MASKGRPEELAGEVWLLTSTETLLRSGGGMPALAVGEGELRALDAANSDSPWSEGSSFPGAVSTLQSQKVGVSKMRSTIGEALSR